MASTLSGFVIAHRYPFIPSEVVKILKKCYVNRDGGH